MGSNGATTRTTDGGATWTLMSGFPDCPVIYGMDFRDAQVGLAGGEKISGNDPGPGIFKTTDAGVTWVRKFSQSANDVLWLNSNDGDRHPWVFDLSLDGRRRNLVGNFKPDFDRLYQNDAAAERHDCRRFRVGRRVAQRRWRF